MLNIKDNNNNNDRHESQEVTVIKAILNQAGITNYDPGVVHQLMYYMNNHVTSVLENAQEFSEHANKKSLDESDVSLALQMHRENELVQISRDINAALANEINCEPLPEIKSQYGLKLPQDKHCLSNMNYRLKETLKAQIPEQVTIPEQQFIQNTPYLVSATTDNNSTVVRRSKLVHVPDQRIVFRPRLKFNIKSAENDYQDTKKQRTN